MGIIPKQPPLGDVNGMGPIGKQGVKVGLRKTRPFFSKCTCQYPEVINKKDVWTVQTLIYATNRKLDGTADGTDTEISSHLTYKWRVRINQDRLYNKKEGTPTRGLGKMAKNKSLPAHLHEKYSRGDDRLNLV